ncbi:hypothetical protein [Streptosporangium roseum]|uniref:hypothetical protein n=1 Tax=Streptosporangium roseum TaxID=2001 RepID=UPI0033288A29
MADQVLTFRGWVRERVAGLANGTQNGRLLVQSAITLSGKDERGALTKTVTRPVRFLFAGPGDVIGLIPGAITRRYPAPGASDHESDRCPHVEFAEPSLPWRYTPATGTGTLHPWLVLVVGVEGEELSSASGHVTLEPAVQLLHPLGAADQPHPWAHVQDDAAGRRVSRVLSGRPLAAGVDYVAVLVPAYDAAGLRRWTGAAPVTVPVYDQWRFRTATPAGSFEDLAARLLPVASDPAIGLAPLSYPRVPAAPPLEIRGALAPLGAADAPLPSAIGDDLNLLRAPGTDGKGRPIVGLPPYGEAWRAGAPEETTWGQTLNGDPRDRGVAGLGLELGIRLQEQLVAESTANLGALAESRQRVSDLVLGLHASSALWKRRMPASPLDRLWLLGPALRRVVTPTGTVADLATAEDRALPSGLFSTAVRRMLRTGPARTARLRAGRIPPAEVLRAANQCPQVQGPADDGVPVEDLGISLKELEQRRRDGQFDLEAALEAAKELAELAHEGLRDLAFLIIDKLAGGLPAPWARALELLIAAAALPEEGGIELERLIAEMRLLLESWPKPADERDLEDLLDVLGDPEQVEPPCLPVNLGGLAGGVVAAFDPTGDQPAAQVRVLSTVEGLDPAAPLAPPEVCVGLDRPVWADVRAEFGQWLLPGADDLAEDSVSAVETNPRFVEALLAGLNTQLLAELRWRDIPVATGCTPLRVFWDRADTTSGARADDIVGIKAWDDQSPLGDASHRPAQESGLDLVIVIRGRLFLRYPSTVVYLVSAEHGGTPDFTRDPDPAAPRVFPAFQGRIGEDVTFFGFNGLDPASVARHWVVFEEPPAGYRFANDVSTATQAHTWAIQALARPVRVLIAGDRLDQEATP